MPEGHTLHRLARRHRTRYAGKQVSVEHATINPKPVQQPSIPIWVGASGRKRSLPLVQEYQVAIEKLLGKKEYSFTSFESYIGAKVAVEAMRRAGPKLTREAFEQQLDALKDFDAGGYSVNFAPANHNGSSFVELTVIGRDLKFNY